MEMISLVLAETQQRVSTRTRGIKETYQLVHGLNECASRSQGARLELFGVLAREESHAILVTSCRVSHKETPIRFKDAFTLHNEELLCSLFRSGSLEVLLTIRSECNLIFNIIVSNSSIFS